MNFPTELRRLRERAKLTQTELATRAGVAQSHVSKAERGTPIMLATAKKLIEACGGRLVVK